MDLRASARRAVTSTRKLRHRGAGRVCNCCGQEFGGFLTVGYPARPDTQCPNCGSRERHRLLGLALAQRPGIAAGRVLHFAPEPAVTRLLKAGAHEYVTTDISQTSDVKADITDLPFPDDRWDLMICSHVLEHVRDDASAMRELRRVLAPGGYAIVGVPRNVGVPTDEDPTITDPKELLRRFGQDDHVRIYGDDLESRLMAAGFTSVEPVVPDDFPADVVESHRLRVINGGTGEILLFCS
jgi:SAM-dependent methyltransferase